MYNVDVCTVGSDEGILRVYRVRVVDHDTYKVTAVYVLTDDDEYKRLVDELRKRQNKMSLTRLLGLSCSLCYTFYGLDKETIDYITGKYGRFIPEKEE